MELGNFYCCFELVKCLLLHGLGWNGEECTNHTSALPLPATLPFVCAKTKKASEVPHFLYQYR